MTRLAEAIEAAGARDAWTLEEHARVDRLRARGALELHELCRKFVDELNGRLSVPAVIFDPQDYSAGNFRPDSRNLYQINLRGRLLQIEFESTNDLYSTENYREKYVLEGAIRSFNQDLLNQSSVDELALYYCIAGNSGTWHCFDGRTYRARKLDRDVLAAELERLV